MKVADLDTPAVLIDLDVVERNIAAAQAQFDRLGIALRPHIKTHKLPHIGRLQLDAGAAGIACQKVSEAEAFADTGFDDILLCFNVLGAAKLDRLAALARKVRRLAVVADNPVVVAALSGRFAAESRPLEVLVECDTGLGRNGVQTPLAAQALAQAIDQSPGLRFGGLMTYPAPNQNARVQAFLTEARDLCLAAPGHCARVSSGGTPSMKTAGEVTVATEYRPGTYVYNDRSLVERGACGPADCALTVLCRVVSRPTGNRGILDAGSKTLTSDLLGLTGYGTLPDYPGALVSGLSEEHGHLDLSQAERRPAVGDLVRVLPNHACPVSNLADTVYLCRGDEVVMELPVAARGRVM
jgi:D-serine deaminase-like pyridoxal phosphate-dependent protein